MASITLTPVSNMIQTSTKITGNEKLVTIGPNGNPSTVSVNSILNKIDDSIADIVEDQVMDQIMGSVDEKFDDLLDDKIDEALDLSNYFTKEQVNTVIETSVGNLDTLTTTNKENVVAAINEVKESIKKDSNDIVDNLTSTETNKALSANQGKVLNDLIQNNINILNNLTNLSIKDLGEGIPPHLALREIIDDAKLNNTKKVQVFKYVDNEGSSTLGICIARLPNLGWIVYLMARKGIEKVVFDAAGNQDEWVPYGGTLEDELDISNDAKLKTLSLNAISIIINDLRTSIQNNTNAINTLTGIGDGSIKLIIDTILKSSDIVKCTYNELKTLIENKELIVGIKYCITDYVTTTSQADTKSANHQFDIIVEALTEDTLSEDAKVCLHDGNAYFSNNDLSAWEIKYCFENDTNRFTWANITEGKGVIYYLKDEFNNECWYDFKNIQFLRTSDFFNTNSFLPHLEGDNYYFTFSNIVNNEIIDGTIYNENITVSIQNKIDKINGTKYGLNNTIFINDSSGYTRYNVIGFGNNNNTFGSKCQANTILQHCYNNVVSTMFRNNVIAQYFCNNKVSGQFEYNTLGIQCYNNSFSGHIWFTTFGSQFNYCSFNIPEDSTLEYCEFGSGIGFLNGIPAIRKVTFENNVAWYNSTTYVSNLQTIDGITLAEALTQDHDDQLYVYKAGDKYGVTSFSEMQNPEPVNIPTLVSNPGTLNDNANNYGYVGTLQNIGVTGDIIVVYTITSYVRTDTASPNSTTPVWCRLLKYVNNAWTIVYQSIDSKIIGDYESGSEFSFTMERKVNDNLTPNDKIAIVYSSTDDITDTLNSTQLGFKCIKNKTGGLNNTLNDDSTGANNYQTALSINYLSMANTPINAVTIENAQTITSTKQFNDGINISGKSFITSAIDGGELKVLHNNSSKGFIVRTVNGSDDILPLEILSTNGSDSYTYTFPTKSGEVVIKEDINNAVSPLQLDITNIKNKDSEQDTEINNVKGTLKQTFAEVASALDEKQPLLTGDEFKTINGESIMGKGNIVISGGEGGDTTIVNDLFSGGENKALSAEMGKELNGKMNYIIPLNVFSRKGAYSIHSLITLSCLKNTEGGSYVTNSPVKSGVIRISNNNTAQAQICFLKTNNFSTTYNHNIKQYLCDGETSAHGIEPGSVLEYETKEPTYIYMVYGANGERIPTFDVVNIPDIDDILELHEQDQELRNDFEESVQQQTATNERLESKTDSIKQVVSSISFEDFVPADGSDIHGTDENGAYKEVTGEADVYYDYCGSLDSPKYTANSLFKEKRRFSVFVKCKLSTEEGDERYNMHARVYCPVHIVQDGTFFTKTPISFETVQTIYAGDFECVGGKEYAVPIKFAFSSLRRGDQAVTKKTMVTCRYYGLYIVPTEDIAFASGQQMANCLDYTGNKTNFFENSISAVTSEIAKQAENANKAKYSEHSEVAHILDTQYRGKVVKVIGDSLVTFISWKNFQKLLGIESVMTGQGGGKVCNNDPTVRHGFCTLERLAMLPRAMKLLVVYGGANDGVKTADTPYEIDPNKLGNINDKPLSIADMCNYRVKDSNVSQTNTLGRAQTFYQGYKTLLRNIQALYPDCQIICVTQHRYYNYVLPDGTFSDKLVPTMGSAEKVAAIKEVAAEYSVPVCDLWETSGVNDHNVLHTLIDSEGVAVHQTAKTAAIEEALILNKVLEIAPKFDIGKYYIGRSDDTVMEMRQWVVDVRSDEECNVMTLGEAIQAFAAKVEADGVSIKKNMLLTFYSGQSYTSKVYFLEDETNPSASSSWQEWTIQEIDDPNDPNN